MSPHLLAAPGSAWRPYCSARTPFSLSHSPSQRRGPLSRPRRSGGVRRIDSSKIPGEGSAYLGLDSATLGSQPRVAACLLCLQTKPRSTREAGEAPRSAPKPVVGAVEAWWWSGDPRAWNGPTTCPLDSVPGPSHTRSSRASSHSGRDTRAQTQSSRRWLARETTRAMFVTARSLARAREFESVQWSRQYITYMILNCSN